MRRRYRTSRPCPRLSSTTVAPTTTPQAAAIDRDDDGERTRERGQRQQQDDRGAPQHHAGRSTGRAMIGTCSAHTSTRNTATGTATA